jgi:small subunit ribosomal protein S6
MEDLILKKYEAIFILDIRKVEDDGTAFTEEFTQLLKSWGGEMLNTEAMGRKPFAREINKMKAGIYWDYVFTLSPEKAAGIPEQFKLDERVIREMVLVYDRVDDMPPKMSTLQKEPVKDKSASY